MKFTLLIFLLTVLSSSAQSHQFTFEDVAPIIFKKCMPCHQKDGDGPFPLENYEEVKARVKLIRYAVDRKIMPPWKADVSYTHFARERVLSDSEITLINTWINDGAPEGTAKVSLKQYPEIIPEGALGEPDMVVRMHDAHQIAGNNLDEFVTYVEELNMPEDRYLRAIRIVPGNRSVLHHCRIDLDTTNSYLSLINKAGYIVTTSLAESFRPTMGFVDDYVPGISAYQYPDSVGMKVFKKMHVMINLHYSPSSTNQKDQTTVYFYFYPKDAKVRPVRHDYLSSVQFKEVRNLIARKDEITTTEMQTDPFPEDFSLLAIQPHMHLIGKYFNVFAITPANDTIPLIKINDWDFNWQENYYFNNLIKIPKGSVFKAIASYDNTVNNPHNPFNPPRDIQFYFDMKTTNEMFEFYTQDLDYMVGDEKRVLYPRKRN